MLLTSSTAVTTAYYVSAIFLALSLYIIYFFSNAFRYWKDRGLDYLQPIIPFGNAYNLLKKECTLGELFAQCYLQLKEKGVKHGGCFVFWKPVYIPVDPEIIKQILIRDFENFPNHGLYISEKNDPISGHIFNMENVKWRNLRAKMPAAFTSAKMRKMFLVMERMTGQLATNLNTYAESGEQIDIKKEITRFTTDIITACAFGMESNTMKNENQEILDRGRSFFDYQWSLYKNTLVLMVPRHILQKFNFRIIPVELEEFFKNFANKVLSVRKDEKRNRGDLMDILIRLTEKHEDERDFTGKYPIEPLNFGELIAQMCVFFAAGFETSSSTQTFALYELARNAECQAKLREEINKTLAKYDNKVTYDAVMEMPYLDQVIDETLRLYPVFPILPRNCNNDYTVPGTDFTIEKDTLVMVSNMGIQRDPEYFPEPDKFKPERFTPENKAKVPFIANLPFGEGPRICVGKRFGLLQTKVGIITVLRNFEVSMGPKTTPSFKFVYNELILRKTGDIWINLKKLRDSR